MRRAVSFLSGLWMLGAACAWAADSSCEVMTLAGDARVTPSAETASRPVAEGELLKPGDLLEVGSGFVDLAYDREWKNATRINGGGSIRIQSAAPAGLDLFSGEIVAVLNQLPEHSTFEIRTAKGTAGVRGTVFKTVYAADFGVFNLSDSIVYVFAHDAAGNLDAGKSAELSRGDKAGVKGGGAAPETQRMSDAEFKAASAEAEALAARMRETAESGRTGKAPRVEDVLFAQTDEDPLRRILDDFEPPDEERAGGGGGGGAGGSGGGGDAVGDADGGRGQSKF